METLAEEIAEATKPKSKLLVVIDADPRTNPRAAEAVRAAGGVSVWGQVEMTVVLRDAAARVLGKEKANLLEAKMFGQFIPMIRENGGAVRVLPDAGAVQVIDPTELVEHGIKEPEFAALTAQCDYVMRF